MLSRALAGAFVAAPIRPLSRAKVLLAVLAVVGGTALGLARSGRRSSFDRVWAEDGNYFLSDALNLPLLEALAKPTNGYFSLLPRLIGEIAARVPLEWVPAVMSLGAAGVSSLYALLVYVASGSHFSTVLPRLMVSAPVVVSHVAILSVPNNVATLQFASLYVMFWMLLWVPASRIGRLIALAVIAVVGLTTILTLALLPLALLRVYLLRDRRSWTVLAMTVIPAAVQNLALVTGFATRDGLSHPRPDPVWALLEYALWGVPNFVLGERWLMPPVTGMNVPPGMDMPTFDVAGHHALLAVAWLIPIGVVLAGLRGLTSPAWSLAAVAFACSIGLFGLELMAMGFPGDDYLIGEDHLLIVERYLLAPGLMAVTALTAVLRPRPASSPASPPWPLVVYATLLLVVCLSGLRADNPRAMTRPWSEMVAEVTAQCEKSKTSHVAGYYGAQIWWPHVKVPCAKVLKTRDS